MATLLQNDGAPGNGTSEVQTVTVTGSPAGGTYRLKYRGAITDPIAFDAAAATVQSALRALSTIGSDGVTVSGSAGGPYTVTFAGRLAKLAVPLIALHTKSFSGGTNPGVTIVEATPGVTATARGAGKGTLMEDTTNGLVYVNTGTATAPTWVKLAAGVQVAHIADVGNSATGTQLATAINAIIDALEAFGLAATS